MSAPITVPLMLRWPWAFAVASVALWAVSAPLNEMLPNQRGETNGMLFNPFAWQLLFHTGVAMGLFGFAEIITNLESKEKRELVTSKVSGLWLTKEQFRAAWPAVLLAGACWMATPAQ